MPEEAKSWADEQGNNLVVQSAHMLFSKRTEPTQPHNVKYENMSILQLLRSRLKNPQFQKELNIPDHAFMLNTSASSNCNYTFAILNVIFLVCGNEKNLTACLEGGYALVYSGLVATDNC